MAVSTYEQDPLCENCDSADDVREVEYDAMVDGPGHVVTELRCAECREGGRC